VETSLLATKLNIPPARPQVINRPRLLERLQEGLKYNFILISAPAGFGKTTLLSEWARQNKPKLHTAWLSLDKGDNDPVRFWDYFIAALTTIRSNIGEKILPWLHSSHLPSYESLLNLLINEVSGIPGNFIAVLDDYHLIESQHIHDGITYLLEHMPVQMNLVIATRADPPLPLAHFRGKGMMQEIRTDDLRFNPEDAASLMKELKTPELSPQDIASLNERTEGWAVGLKMAALSLMEQKDIPGFIKAFTGSQRYVMDYLLEEVLQKQTSEIRDFLLQTSVLERLSGPLCDVITGSQNSNDTLTKLEQGHLFIVPLDESRQWYRYEHLFSDLLRHQLKIVYGVEQIPILHHKARQWYEDHGFPDDATHHALAAKDWVTAIRLIYPRCEEFRNRGEWNYLLGWIQIIPEEILRTHHRLYCQYASFLSAIGKLDAAEAALSYLESAAVDDAVLQSDVAFLLGNIACRRWDIERVEFLTKKSLSLLPPENILMRSRAKLQLAFIKLTKCLFDDAERLMTESYKMSIQAGDIWLASAALGQLGDIKHQYGELHRAVELYKKAIEVAGETQGAAWGASGLSKVLYEWNDLEIAAQNAKRAIEWYELGGNAEPAIPAYYIQSQICLVRGNKADIVALIEKMDQANHQPALAPQYYAYHAAYHMILSIRQQDLEAARKWNKKISEYSQMLLIEYQSVPARLLIAQDKKEEALNHLQKLYNKFIKIGAYGLLVGIRVYQALAAETEEAAVDFLTNALKIAEPEGHIRTFVDEGKLLKPLLEKALSRGTAPEYVRKLLTIIEAEERQKLKKKKGEETHSRYGSLLSGRELEVLKLMAEGLSNQQIADRLVISLSTAKNHVHNIIEKLNAKGRTQAIAQARELELM
jgi:LuxR family maltose regulon positive regulatory protein